MTEFHKAVDSGDFGNVKLLLSADNSLVNCASEQGIYPLQQACFRGHVDVAEYLLKNGADVNSQDRSQGYTPLMFAAITGGTELVELLLQHGARSNDTNKLGRNASQMASFVGNHHIATVINNFLDKVEVDQYTLPNVRPNLKLPTSAANLLYGMIMSVNFTPVKILLILNSTITSHDAGSCLFDLWRPASNVLDDLIEKYFTPHQTHEALALKFHLLACCLRRAGEYVEKEIDTVALSSPDTPNGLIENLKKTHLLALVRQLLRGTDPHGLPFGQEKFLRQALSSFPHRESILWRHVIRRSSEVQPGHSPTVLSILECAINGQNALSMPMGDSVSQACATCGDSKTKNLQIQLCHNCKEVGYCSVNCQRLHWFTHKKYCSILKIHHDRCTKSLETAELTTIDSKE